VIPAKCSSRVQLQHDHDSGLTFSKEVPELVEAQLAQLGKGLVVLEQGSNVVGQKLGVRSRPGGPVAITSAR
jgi:hypothetical protein